MKTIFTILPLAAVIALSSCGSEPSFYDKLTDEQKEEVSYKGFDVKSCINVRTGALDMDEVEAAIRIDLATLGTCLDDTVHISYDNLKLTDKPFAALTLNVPYGDNFRVIYYYDGVENIGFAVPMGAMGNLTAEEVYFTNRDNIMKALADNGLVASDWETSTSPEEQLLWVTTYLMAHADITAMAFKFTNVTVDGEDYRVTAVLGH